MKKTTKKVLYVALWFIGFPIIIKVLGIFMWITCLIDFIDKKEVRRK